MGVAPVELDGDAVLSPKAVDDVCLPLCPDGHVCLRLPEPGAAPQFGEAVLELAPDDLSGPVLRDRALQSG